MSLKKINPKDSAFIYNPRTNDFILISEINFVLNYTTKSFEVDQNPHGESNCTPISNISTNYDYSSLMFDTIYRKKETSFSLTSNHDFDKIIYHTIYNFDQLSYMYTNNDKDKIEIYFSDGFFSKLYLYKHENNKLIDTMTLLSETDGLYIIKQNPWRKFKINLLEIKNSEIICKNDHDEFSFNIQNQTLVKDLIISLLKPIINI